MRELDPHQIFQLGLMLVILAAGITAIAKKFRQPYPIALVIVGALIGLITIPLLEPLKTFITEGQVFNFVILTLFLPALLGEAALKLPVEHLKKNKKPIIALALGGTLLSFLITGFSTHFLLNFSLPVAFVFAALMSATDPVSVLSIFKGVGVKKDLATVIEGESLFNDGLAVVLFKISAFYLLTYLGLGWQGAASGLLEFVQVILGGVVIGSALGYLFSRLFAYFDDYPLEIIFSIILFYGSFIVAEYFHVSGVIAVVTAALTLGNYGAKIGMSPTTKLNLNSFWDAAALLANSLVFLMVGLEITRIDIHAKWGIIGLAILIVLVARTVAVFASLAFIKGFPRQWKHILNWGGLKGSLSIALALSLPYDFAGREDIILLSFSVVLFSLVVQGLTIKPLISVLGVEPANKELREYEELLTYIHQYEAGIDEILRVKTQMHMTEPVFAGLLEEYRRGKAVKQHDLEILLQKQPDLVHNQLNKLRLHALYAQHERVTKLEKEEVISEETAENLKRQIIDKIIASSD